MSEKISIKANFVFNIFFQILSVLVPLVTTPYVSRTLGAEKIGLYSYALSVVSYFGVFGCLGFSTYGQLQIAKIRDNKEKRSKIFIEIMICRTAMMLIVLIPYLIVSFISRSNSKMFFLLIIYLITQMIDISWYYQALEQFKATITRNAIVRIIGLVLIFIFVKSKSDIYLYALILQGSALIGLGSLWLPLGRYVVLTKIEINNFKVHLKGNIVYFIPTIASTVFTLLDKCMLGWIGQSNFDNGYYEQSFKLYQMISGILNSFSVVLLPRMAYLWADENKNQDKIALVLSKAFKAVGLLSFPMAVGLFCVSPQLIPIFLGPGFEPCILLTRIFSIMVIVSCFNNILGQQCLISRGKQNKYNKAVIIGASINVLLNTVLIKLYGSTGAAVASVFSEIIVITLLFIYSSDVADFKRVLKSVWKYVIMSIIMGIIIIIIENKCFNSISTKWLIVEMVTGVLLYGMQLLFFRDELVYGVLKNISERISRKRS